MIKKDKIESLSPRDHVRLRPGMYISSVANPNHLLIETFANALDMHNAGYGNKITVTVNKDNVCTCKDEGTGFSIDEIRPEDNKSILQAAFDVINSSGKYSNDGFYEGSSLGANGVGLKAVNFLSEWLEVKTWNNGKFEKLKFERGILKNRELGDCHEGSGTIITYLPDQEIFDTVETDIKYFQKFFNDISFLCNNLTIIFNGEEIHHDSIKDSVNDKIKDVELFSNRLVIQEEKINLVMTYQATSSSSISCYVNYGYTDAGPHITLIKSCITRTLNKWAKEQKLLKEKDKNLDGNSLQEGLILVCNLIGTNIVYDSQSKQRVTKMDTSILSSTFSEALEIYLDNNPDDGKAIIEKALVSRKAAEAAKRARERIKNKAAANTKKKNIQLPTTLTDCWSKDRLSCELLIAEGKSAASGLVAARDSETQAVYGVRGKMLSVLKTAPPNIYKNQEINNLVQALGLEVEPSTCKLKYDRTRLRYGKIVACADADFDGFAIENLLFNILWYMCPELILNGHVYSAVPPLFRVTTKKNEYIYLRDERALEDYKNKNQNNIQIIGRMKGLGECDSDELAYCLLDKKTRNVLQLKVTDRDKTDEMFNNLYGKAVGPRVTFLAEHLEEARVE